MHICPRETRQSSKNRTIDRLTDQLHILPCPILFVQSCSSPNPLVNHSRIPYRDQLIGPSAASAGTSLEYPSKSVAGARYVDLRQSPRSSNDRGSSGGEILDRRPRTGSTNIPTNRPRVPPLRVPRLAYTKYLIRVRAIGWRNEIGGRRCCEKEVRRGIKIPPVKIHRWPISGPRSVEETLARIGDTTRLLSAKG